MRITSRIVKRLMAGVLLAGFIGASGTQMALAFDLQFFSGNDIIYWDPDCKSSAGGTVVITGTASKSLEEFVDKYGQMAFDTGKRFGIPYEAILAQGALESGMGSSGLTQKANNFFGIKAGSSWTGDTINMQTGEQTSGGQGYTVNAAFRKYPTPQAGWDGYGQFITENPRYKEALKYPGDPLAYITAIKAAGYATDVSYVSKVGGLINSITEYIKKTNKWPPSSEVAKTNTPTGGGSSPTSSSKSCTTSSSTGNGSSSAIVQTALSLAWPNRGKHNGTAKSLARDEYQIAMPKYNDYSNAGEDPWTDCGVFVATVMRASGADPKYVGRGTGSQLNYVKTDPKYYAFIPKDTSELQPGDTMTLNGHTYIYTGPYKGDDGKDYTIAQASLYDHPPEAGNVFLSDSRGKYTAARIKLSGAGGLRVE
jgi:hypothetical protein